MSKQLNSTNETQKKNSKIRQLSQLQDRQSQQKQVELRNLKDEIRRWKEISDSMKQRFSQKDKELQTKINKNQDENEELKKAVNKLLVQRDTLLTKLTQIRKAKKLNSEVSEIEELKQKLEEEVERIDSTLPTLQDSLDHYQMSKEFFENFLKQSNNLQVLEEQHSTLEKALKNEVSQITQLKEKYYQLKKEELKVITGEEKVNELKMQVQVYRELAEKFFKKSQQSQKMILQENKEKEAEIRKLTLEIKTLREQITQINLEDPQKFEEKKQLLENSILENRNEIMLAQFQRIELEVKRDRLTSKIDLLDGELSRLQQEKLDSTKQIVSNNITMFLSEQPENLEFSQVLGDLILKDNKLTNELNKNQNEKNNNMQDQGEERKKEMLQEQEKENELNEKENEINKGVDWNNLNLNDRTNIKKELTKIQEKINVQKQLLKKINEELEKTKEEIELKEKNLTSLGMRFKIVNDEYLHSQQVVSQMNSKMETLREERESQIRDHEEFIEDLEQQIEDLKISEQRIVKEGNEMKNKLEDEYVSIQSENRKLKKEIEELSKATEDDEDESEERIRIERDLSTLQNLVTGFASQILGEAIGFKSIDDLKTCLVRVKNSMKKKTTEIETMRRELTKQSQLSETFKEEINELTNLKSGKKKGLFGRKKKKTRSSSIGTNSKSSSKNSDRENQSNDNNNNEDSLEKINVKDYPFIHFDILLQKESYLKHFMEFLEIEINQENLLFWIDVENFKIAKEKELVGLANKIFEKYIPEGSKYQINIDSLTLQKIKEGLEKIKPNRTLFNAAQQKIYVLLLNDCFPRFIESQNYVNLIRENPKIEWANK
ncbi:hypothetical protein M0813_24331 [Anaeramoeba flamelloides]|uniref:RGS domain-containing protein n=1 Tax=Anaeramoeba flamelloides TaxID=1746091 RepID=A0AAV7YTZ3_9EUKA|nr:hypothetical protein M0812_21315 [Anaeramoeba flamelloides]KAJ6240333.1 hypothetical protein M0813_24331 [Anaeramoeba flamelloides]